jgi:dodecin
LALGDLRPADGVILAAPDDQAQIRPTSVKVAMSSAVIFVPPMRPVPSRRVISPHSSGRRPLANHIYSVTEIAGSSEISHADAIEKAVERASKTLRHLAWLEVKEQRAEIVGSKIQNYQVVMKIGFRMED